MEKITSNINSFCVYGFFSNEESPFYIGQTNYFEKRKADHYKRIEKSEILQKNGIELLHYKKANELLNSGNNLEIKIIHNNLTKSQANILELYYIDYFNLNQLKKALSEKGLKHGKTYSKIYRAWCNLRRRCFDPNNKHYKDYGGRGITYCERWKDFKNFYEDMGDPPSLKHSIDRIENNGNYCKENCKWSTMSEQARNTRRNKNITYKGITKTLIDWSEDLKLDYFVLRKRFKDKWSAEEAFETPINDHLRIIKYKGQEHNLKQWSEILNINYRTLRDRLEAGASIKEAFETEVNSYIKKFTYRNKTLTLSEWSKELNIPIKTLHNRYERNWSVEKIFSTLKGKNNPQKSITFNNITKSVSEWAKELGLKRKTLYDRIFKLNWNMDRILKELKND